MTSEERLSDARARLIAAAAKRRQRKVMTAEEYYGGGTEEAPVPDADCDRLRDAVLTRNHYGCVVLNTANTLFIDVDMLEHADDHARSDPWAQTLNDLRTVLGAERSEGFRVYRTAAGFRVLATAHEFEPDSPAAQKLMQSSGADAAFVHLCRLQRNFRARLSPKPWRCGVTRPPTCLAKASPVSRQHFTTWLEKYEHACRAHATCRYLEHVGAEMIHPRIAPVIELHDLRTRATELLPLA